MSTPWSTSRWMLFLAIMLVALPGMDLSAKYPLAGDVYIGHPRPSTACDSETPVLLYSNSQIKHLMTDRWSLYWITSGQPGAVMKMPKRNGKVKVLAELEAYPSDMVMDNTSVFWVEDTWQPVNKYTLKKVDKHGLQATELWQAPGWMGYLNQDKRNLYWLDYEADAGMRISKQGGQPEVLISPRNGINNFAFLHGKVYLGGHDGLGVLEPGRMPRILITSEQLLRDLHLGLRDERSRYYAGPAIAEYDNEIIFVFSVANNPGWGSCNDNKDHIVALPLSGGKPRILLSVSGSMLYGSLIDVDLLSPYLYTIGRCQGGQMTNLDTGKTSTITEIQGRGPSTLAVDKRYIYWASGNGLMCMQRPTE